MAGRGDEGDVVSADIPYENTSQRGYGKGTSDKQAFVDWAQAQDFPVYVSLYTMPEGWVEIDSIDVTDRMHNKRQEKLWVQEKFADEVIGEEVADGGEMAEESQVRFSVVEDPFEVARLEAGPKVKRYRAMVEIDGKLYPPMSVYVDGKLREPTKVGVWERSDETPFDFTEKQLTAMKALDAKNGEGTVTLIKGKLRYHKGSETGKGKLQFRLKKDNGSDVWAAYNPYFHTSTSGMNDQFASAWNRPNLVVVEVLVPEGELTDKYKAPHAKDKVGNTPWKSGSVNKQLPEDRQRTVTLSRYAKVVGKVDDAEVAKGIAEQLKGLNIKVPFNVVTPSLRDELVKLGVKIGPPEKSNAGNAARSAYKEWKKSNAGEDGVRFSIGGSKNKKKKRKNNESATKGSASGLGQPTQKGA